MTNDKIAIRNHEGQMIGAKTGITNAIRAEEALFRIMQVVPPGAPIPDAIVRAQKAIDKAKTESVCDVMTRAECLEWKERQTIERTDLLLDLLAICGTTMTAITATMVTSYTANKRRNTDRKFAKRWKAALQTGGETIVLKLRELALVGQQRKKFTADGKPIIDPETGKQYIEREYDTGSAKFLARAAFPEVFGPRRDEQARTNQPISFSLNIGTKVVNAPDTNMVIRQEQKPEIVDGEVVDQRRIAGDGPAISGEGPPATD